MRDYMTTIHQTAEVFHTPRDVENTGVPWGLHSTHVIGGLVGQRGGAQVIACVLCVWSRELDAAQVMKKAAHAHDHEEDTKP